MLLKSLTLHRKGASKQDVTPSLFDETTQGLTCLMIASKVQDSDLHLRVENVVQLLRKFLEDNQALQSTDIPGMRPSNSLDEQFSSRRLQNRALLEKVASLEKTTICDLNFCLNVATPAEFVVVYLQMFETKVTQIDWETIMMLRGQSLSNSYICLHVVECVLLGAQAIALASILNVMLDWHWNEVADNFIELMQTDAADSCTVEDIIVCQHRLQEIIMRENRQANQSDTEPEQVERQEDSDEEEEFKEGAAALTTVHEQSDFTESAIIHDRFATRCSLCNSQKTVGQRDPAYCDVHGEHDHAGA